MHHVIEELLGRIAAQSLEYASDATRWGEVIHHNRGMDYPVVDASEIGVIREINDEVMVAFSKMLGE